MKKLYCLVPMLLLLLWFFLDMTGVYFGGKCLVTRSYKEDGVFFLIYAAALILFLVYEPAGKWAVIGWLAIWFAAQFMSHEWYTIFGSGLAGTVEGKIRFFSGTIKLIRSETRYFPDLYHTVLHILILWSLISGGVYTAKLK